MRLCLRKGRSLLNTRKIFLKYVSHVTVKIVWEKQQIFWYGDRFAYHLMVSEAGSQPFYNCNAVAFYKFNAPLFAGIYKMREQTFRVDSARVCVLQTKRKRCKRFAESAIFRLINLTDLVALRVKFVSQLKDTCVAL